MLISILLLTGCSLDNRCEKGFNFENDKCVKIDEIGAIHKLYKECMTGYEIDGVCYRVPNSQDIPAKVEIDDETGEESIICPDGYTPLEEKVCRPVYNAMTPKEYYECPEGYTFNKDGVKKDQEEDNDGLNAKCYKRIEKEVKK